MPRQPGLLQLLVVLLVVVVVVALLVVNGQQQQHDESNNKHNKILAPFLVRRKVAEMETTTRFMTISDDVFNTDDYESTTTTTTGDTGDVDIADASSTTVLLPTQDMSIVELLATLPELSTFYAALKRTNLLDTLTGNNESTDGQSLTLFIPTNDAFETTPSTTTTTTPTSTTLDSNEYDLLTKVLWWTEWRLHLKDLLMHHVYRESLSYDTIMSIMNTTTTTTTSDSSNAAAAAAAASRFINMANGETVSLTASTATPLSVASSSSTTTTTGDNSSSSATTSNNQILMNNKLITITSYYELSNNGNVYTISNIMFPSFAKNTIETVVAGASASSSSSPSAEDNMNPLASSTTTTTSDDRSSSSTSSISTNIFNKLLVLTGLDNELSLNRPNAAYTVFAPTDAAFAKAGIIIVDDDDDTLSSWQTENDNQELKNLLRYHIVPGVYASSSFTQDNGSILELITMSNSHKSLTIAKSQVSINNGRTVLRINDNSDSLVTLISPDHLAQNGIVHVISQVLKIPTPPPTTTMTSGISDSSSSTTTTTTTTTLANILLDTPELQVLGEALEAIGLVTRHDEKNGGSSISSILGVDASANDDVVVLPMSTTTTTLLGFTSTSTYYTVFAPENQAFNNNGLVNMYFNDPNGYALHLYELFIFHITPGQILLSATDLQANNDKTIQMLNHQNLTVQQEQADYGPLFTLRPAMNNVATVMTSNILATNGVVHMISNLLLPPFALQTLWSWMKLKTPMFTMLLEAADMQDVLKTKASLTVFAPSDDAIDKLGADTLAFLLSADGQSTLVDLVSYHIVDSLHPSTLIKSKQQKGQRQQQQPVTVPTLLMGRHLDLVIIDKTSENGMIIRVNAGMAQVTSADNLVSNGIIHVIDTVLEIPPITTSSNNNIAGNEVTAAASPIAKAAVTTTLLVLFATATAAAAAAAW